MEQKQLIKEKLDKIYKNNLIIKCSMKGIIDPGIDYITDHLEDLLLNMEEVEEFVRYEYSNKDFIKYNKEMYNTLIDIIENKTIPEDISREIFDDSILSMYRGIYTVKVGFSMVTKKFIRTLNEKVIKNSKCLEIMCGNGFISKALREEGVEIIATDNYCIDYGFSNKVDGIIEMDCLDAISKYGKEVDFIICSWIPYGSDIGYKALKLMNEINPNCKMISIKEYAACAEDSFFEHSDTIQSFDNKNIMSYCTGEDTVYYRA